MVRSCGRALLAIAIVVGTTVGATAQFGGMPGLPGGPPGGSPAETFRGPPYGPPPKCQALLAIRDELQKHGQAISAANDKPADVKVACGLFRRYLATEAKMIQMLEADGPGCGASAQVVEQVRDSHTKAQQIGKQVCDAAQRRPERLRPDDDYWRQYNPDRDRRERWRQYQRLADAGAQSGTTPPPQCGEFLALPDELQRQRQAIEAANKKRTDVRVTCKLYRTYIATYARSINMLEADGQACGAPSHLLQQARGNHARLQQIGKMVCDAAARQPPYNAPPIDGIDGDTIRPFRLHPEPRPKALPGAYTAP